MITCRPFVIDDYDEVARFWGEHYKISDRDSLKTMTIFLDKNPGLSMLAIGEGGQIIGTCLGSFDGRKGFIQKMAVNPLYRGQGVGKRLAEEALVAMRAEGALEFRVDCDEKVAAFYEACGFSRYDIVSLRIKEY